MGLLLLEPITASLQIVPDSCLWGFWCVILCPSDFLLAASTECWGNEDISFWEGDWLEQPSCPVISTVWLLGWDRTPWIIKAAAIRKMSCIEMSRNVRLSRITPCVRYLVISESNYAMFAVLVFSLVYQQCNASKRKQIFHILHIFHFVYFTYFEKFPFD